MISPHLDQAKEGDLVLQALRYAAALKDPVGFVNSPVKGDGAAESDVFAWRMFKSVMKVYVGTELACELI
jgi:hypothetical protein